MKKPNKIVKALTDATTKLNRSAYAILRIDDAAKTKSVARFAASGMAAIYTERESAEQTAKRLERDLKWKTAVVPVAIVDRTEPVMLFAYKVSFNKKTGKVGKWKKVSK